MATRKSRAQALAPSLAVGVLGRIVTLPPVLHSLQSRPQGHFQARVQSESWPHWGTRQAPPPQQATMDPGPLYAARWTAVACSTRRR